VERSGAGAGDSSDAADSSGVAEKEVEAFWDYYMDDHALDFQIWNHKRYLDRPVLATGDGDVASFRRWFRQFYSPSESTAAASASALSA
jgi:hypothetical protein